MIILRHKRFSRFSNLLTTLGRGKNRLETLGMNTSTKISNGFNNLISGGKYQPTSIVNYAVPKSRNQINNVVNNNLSNIKGKASDFVTNSKNKVNQTIYNTAGSLNNSLNYVKSHTPGQVANDAVSFTLGHPVAAASPIIAAANIAYSPLALKALPVGSALTTAEVSGLGSLKPYTKITKKLQSAYNNSKLPGIVEKGVDNIVNYFPK